MGFSRGGGGRSSLSEINVTPLVDVMLVLLIIFMVTAPLIQQGVKVDLPTAKAAPVEEKEKKVVLSVRLDKTVWIGDAEIPFEELEVKLSTNEKLKADKELFFHADRNLPYGYIVEVMAIIQRAGIPAIGMITDPTERVATDEASKGGKPGK